MRRKVLFIDFKWICIIFHFCNSNFYYHFSCIILQLIMLLWCIEIFQIKTYAIIVSIHQSNSVKRYRKCDNDLKTNHTYIKIFLKYKNGKRTNNGWCGSWIIKLRYKFQCKKKIVKFFIVSLWMRGSMSFSVSSFLLLHDALVCQNLQFHVLLNLIWCIRQYYANEVGRSWRLSENFWKDLSHN